MSNLQVRTRGNSSPQGKPRVYFSCHPEDFADCFEAVAEEILQSQNCAIWHETDWDSVLDESQLSQMQMFVIPITTKYLTCPNRSRSEEYGFAVAQHIPILPILMESGLEASFAEIMNREGEGFGDLQFLDRASEDKTAIPYAEKLEKRLSAILTSDETAARVRAAFDAYIFLSYRKKDRAAAQSLMRLIHQIPYCRDIAIWYDEFLVPGERWAKTIAEAMERSQLITFAITPNMTERGNYVVEHEFPEAMRSGKPLVPAEMEITDRAVLEELFPGLPELVDGKKLADLEQALRRIALEENDHDSMHNYLIGLAYLGGIDVERNPQRALELIRGAAEAQLPEAMSRLVEMYGSGEGVSRDYSAAVDWQERLVDLHRHTFRQTQGEEEADALFSALWGLLYRMDVLCREDGRRETVQEMLRVAEYTSQAHRKENLSVSYDCLGDIARTQGRLEEAKAYYKKGQELSKELAEGIWTERERRNLSTGCVKLGIIAEEQGQLEEAKTYYEKGMMLDKELAEELGTVETRRALSASYNNLGDIARAQGQLESARAYYEQGFIISKALAEETGTVRVRQSLSVCYSNLGDIARTEGQLGEAVVNYEQGLAIRKALAEETGTVSDRRSLSVCYSNLGDIARAQGRLGEAVANYEQGFIIRKALAEETGTVSDRRNLALSYMNRGDIARAQKQLEEAASNYEQGLIISKALAEETGTVEARRNLGAAHNRLGGVAKARGQLEAAKVCFEQGFVISKALAEETGTVQARRDLSSSYNNLGDIAQEQGLLEETKACYEQGMALCKALAEETGTVQDCTDLAISYINLWMVEKPGIENQEYLSQAVHIYEMLVRAYPDVENYQNMLNFLKQLDK